VEKRETDSVEILNDAKMETTYFHFALECAWKLHSVLPHKALTKTDGKTQCPLGVYTGQPASVSNFRVMCCPAIMPYNNIHKVKTKVRAEPLDSRKEFKRMETLNRKNCSQRALRGVFVGLPRHSKGHLIYVPLTNKIYCTMDECFDEEFK
jgi:hypothetical protein